MEETSKLILQDLDQANNNSNRMDEYYPFDQAGELCFFYRVLLTCSSNGTRYMQ